MFLLRKSANLFDDKLLISMSLMRIVPLSALSSVPIICSKVVLPAPLGPTILTTSPLSMCKSIPFSTCSLPKDFDMFFTSIILVCKIKNIFLIDQIICLFERFFVPLQSFVQ